MVCCIYCSYFRSNIRVNAVLPGFIATPMIEKIPDKVMQGLLANIPLGREGTPQGMFNVLCDTM